MLSAKFGEQKLSEYKQAAPIRFISITSNASKSIHFHFYAKVLLKQY